MSLIYQQLFFTPKNLKSYSLKLYDSDGDRDFTRDQLLVNGDLLGEEINFLVLTGLREAEDKKRTKKD